MTRVRCPHCHQLIEATKSIWVRVGDAGGYESFDSLNDALSYLNKLKIGEVTRWRTRGFNTPHFWGYNYISIYHDELNALTAAEKAALESGLVA